VHATKTYMAALLPFLLLLFSQTFAYVPIPELTGRVVDQTGTLSESERSALEAKLRAFEEGKGSQVAVLIVATTQPEAIEQFSIRLADKWKLGRKKVDDGAILLVAKEDRIMRIEVGYGLEGAVTDAISKRIISEIITPQFKNGDFVGGINSGITALLNVIEGEPLPTPQKMRASGNKGNGLNTGFLIFAIFISIFLSSIFGRVFGGILSGSAIGILAFIFLGSIFSGILFAVLAFFFALFGGGFGGGGLGGFGRSGGRFGGGFGGGGFSGGGGGFGGGGASGRW
jgi:uncharacterized protein